MHRSLSAKLFVPEDVRGKFDEQKLTNRDERIGHTMSREVAQLLRKDMHRCGYTSKKTRILQNCFSFSWKKAFPAA